MQPFLRLAHASFGYPETTVLRNVSLSLPSGSFTLLLGDNGAGKTTFLRTLCGLLPLRAGKMDFSSASQPNQERRKIGLLEQNAAPDSLYLFSGHEVALSGLRLARPWWRRISFADRQRVAALLRQLAPDFFRQPFSRLSGGQQQRILLARALAMQSELLVLDEPVSALDAAAAVQVRSVLRQQHQAGLTILLATHEPDFWAENATHTLTLHHGSAVLAQISAAHA